MTAYLAHEIYIDSLDKTTENSLLKLHFTDVNTNSTYFGI